MTRNTIDYVKADIGDKIEFLLGDLLDCSYVLLQVLGFRGEGKIGKTMFFKTIANLLIDFTGRRFLRWEPHPFGAVPIIPAKGGYIFRSDSYLHSDHILEMNLWRYEQEGRRGYFGMEDLHRDGIERKMQDDSDRKFLLQAYSRIYSSLPNKRLNQLATCRDEFRTFQCADYEENLWLKKMAQTLGDVVTVFDQRGATIDYAAGRRFKKNLTDTAIAAKQVSVKIEMFRDNQSLLDLMEDCKRDGLELLIDKLIGTIEVKELTERLASLEERGQNARRLTTLLRLLCSAFGIEEEPELARIDKSGQYRLFTNYITPIQDTSLELGKRLGIRSKKMESKCLIDLLNQSNFHAAANHLDEVYFKRLRKIIVDDESKKDGFKRSDFSVIDRLSFLDFQIN
jgi:hypothetical protein